MSRDFRQFASAARLDILACERTSITLLGGTAMRTRKRFSRTMACAFLLALGTSCAGTGDDLARGLVTVADDADSLTRSRWMPRHVPKPVVTASSEAIIAAGDRIGAPVAGLSPEEQKQATKIACQATEAVEAAAGGPEEITSYVASFAPTGYAYKLEAEDLAENLVDAGTSLEQAVILARAGICEWASS